MTTDLFWDHKQISDKLGLWCRIIDARALDQLPEVFDPSVEWDFGGGTVDHNLSAVIERIQAHLVEQTYCGNTHHQLANLQIDIAGDQAESDAYFFASHAGIEAYAGKTLLQWGKYTDSWRRTDNGWRIVRRLYRVDISEGPMEIVYANVPEEMWNEGDERKL